MKEGFVWRMGLTKKRRKHRRLLAETGGCCIYCGRPISEYNATLDHIIPMSRGGYSEDENLVVCCKECNYRKYTFYVRDFIALMPFRKQRAFYNRVRTLYHQGKICEEKYMLLTDSGSVNKVSRIYIEFGRFQFRFHFHLNIKKKEGERRKLNIHWKTNWKRRYRR